MGLAKSIQKFDEETCRKLSTYRKPGKIWEVKIMMDLKEKRL